MIDVVALAFAGIALVLALAAMLQSKATARELADHQALAILERRRQETDEHRVQTNGHHR